MKNRYYNQGLDLSKKGKFREASLAFRKAIQKDSDFGDAYYQLGLTELQPGGDAMRALAALRRAVILLPKNEDPKIRLSEIYLAAYIMGGSSERYPIDEAKKLSDLLLTRNPKSYHGLRLNGHVAALENRPKDAIEFFRKADAIKPGQKEVLLPMAQALTTDKQTDAAEKVLRDVIQRDKACDPAYEILYRQYLEAKRLVDAESVLKQRAENVPDSSQALLQLAEHYFRQQKTTEMEAALARLRGDSKRFPQGRLQSGDFYRAIGRNAQARAEYQAGVQFNNTDKLEYQKRLASILLLEGKRDDAIQAYEGVAKQLPQDEESREARAALLLERDVDTALKEFKTLVDEFPNNPSLRYNLGQAYLAKRDLAQARLSFLEARRRDRTFLLPRIALAQLSLQASQFNEVEEYATDILRVNPSSPEGRFFQSAAWVGLGNYGEARRELVKLSDEFPTYNEVKLELAFLDLAERKFAAAETTLRKLYESTKDVRALHGMADVFIAQNQDDRAIALVDAELKKNPSLQRVRLLLAQIALQLKKYQLAIEHLTQLAAVDPKWDFLYLRAGEAYQFTGDLSRAVASFRRARQLSPKSLEAAARLGYALEVAGQYKEAIANYREALAINPNIPVIMNNLAYLLSEQGGNLDEALRLTQTALRRMPQQKDISDTLGWITLRKNDTDAALQIFRSLVRKYPDEPLYRYHLAMALFQKGDRNGAKTEANMALERKPAASDETKIRTLLARVQ